MDRSRSNESGVALALALIATLLVTLIAFEVAHTSRVEQFITDNFEIDTKLELACHGGLEVALARLREDRQQTEIDSTFDAWYPLIVHSDMIEADVGSNEFLYDDENRTTEKRDIVLHIKIFDEAAKFNLYELLNDDPEMQRKRKEALANVLDYYRDGTNGDLGISEAQQIAEEIFTFIRRTKDQPYGEAPKPPTKEERTLVDTSELLYVTSITPEMYFDRLEDIDSERIIPGLYRFLTIYGGMQINLNTAPHCVLAGLFDAQNVSLADRIEQYRTEHAEEKDRTRNDVSETGSFNPENAEETDPTGGAPFSQINELREKVESVPQQVYNEISQFLTVKSDTFTIFVTANWGLIKRTKMYVVSRSERGWRLLYEKLVDFPYLTSVEELEGANDRALEEQREREDSGRTRR